MTLEATENGQVEENFLEMSDEDFLKAAAPSSDDASGENAQGEAQQETAETSPPSSEAQGQTTESNEGAGAAEPDAAVGASAEEPKSTEQSSASNEAVKSDEASKEEQAPAADAQPEAEKKTINYEEFFNKIMTPFKANGRTFEVKTPEEAIRLMQMGAGYGRKIQDLQPHLKVLRMLEKNNLLDEGKLSYLIDINQKNPDAIKKLVKDSGLDPLDMNTNEEVTYTPQNHAVSDREVEFQNVLSEVQELPRGEETLQIINQTWDKESKAVLWDSPEIIKIIQSQRENGIYDTIVAEIDRQKILGHIPHSTPFLKAYKLAGDHLQANNGFKTIPQQTQIQNQPVEQPQPQVIATRTAAPKAQVTNSDKAAAASPTKMVGSRKAAITVNPLEMADDEFMKTFSGRF